MASLLTQPSGRFRRGFSSVGVLLLLFCLAPGGVSVAVVRTTRPDVISLQDMPTPCVGPIGDFLMLRGRPVKVAIAQLKKAFGATHPHGFITLPAARGEVHCTNGGRVDVVAGGIRLPVIDSKTGQPYTPTTFDVLMLERDNLTLVYVPPSNRTSH